jgi:hypothetical protein
MDEVGSSDPRVVVTNVAGTRFFTSKSWPVAPRLQQALGGSARRRYGAWHYGRNRRGQPDQATTLVRFFMRLDVRQSPHRLFDELFARWLANSNELAR